jgi:hypothetical protein
MLGLRIARPALLAAILLVFPAAALPAQPKVIDQEWYLKAAFLYNLGTNVRWPVPFATFHIGVLGQDRFEGYLQKMQGLTVHTKPVVVHCFASMADYQPCHILFISPTGAKGREQETARQRLDAALKQIADKPVLVVGDGEGWATQGAIIGFVVRENRLHMEINNEAAKKAGLDISSKVLDLKIVTRVGEENSRSRAD